MAPTLLKIINISLIKAGFLNPSKRPNSTLYIKGVQNLTHQITARFQYFLFYQNYRKNTSQNTYSHICTSTTFCISHNQDFEKNHSCNTALNHKPTGTFKIDGFQTPFRKDNDTNGGGGIIVYVRDNINAKRREDLETNGISCLWLEISPVRGKSFLVGNMY